MNRRQGTMTKILECLKNYSYKNGFKFILIQSIITKEMSNFAIKNGFVPDEYTMDFEGTLLGDYFLKIK